MQCRRHEKKIATNCEGGARLYGDLTWSDVYDQHGVGKTASPHWVSAHSCCKRILDGDLPFCHAKKCILVRKYAGVESNAAVI